MVIMRFDDSIQRWICTRIRVARTYVRMYKSIYTRTKAYIHKRTSMRSHEEMYGSPEVFHALFAPRRIFVSARGDCINLPYGDLYAFRSGLILLFMHIR